MIQMSHHTFLVLLCSLLYFHANAQKSLSLKECEDAFQKNNLLLLAEQYNIDVSKANVIQAKIWDQPLLSGELNAISPQDNSYFNIGKNGQKGLAIQQLIYLGKKKKYEVEYAKSNTPIAELQFQQLLKNLNFQLRQSFYTVYFAKEKYNNLQIQISNIDSLAIAYSVQANKGNIPLRDVVRLQSLVMSLKNDLIDIQKTINNEQETLKNITRISENINPVIVLTEIEKKINIQKIPPIDSLVQLAMQKNPAFLSSLKTIDSNEKMLKWQQSLAVPDLTAGASYDQNGGAFHNQINLTLGIPLPLWNKNKGNIQAAQIQLSQANIQKDYKVLELKAKIENAYSSWSQKQLLFSQRVLDEGSNLDLVYKGVLQNFLKRNISLLEFTDFMESYNQNIAQLNELKKSLLLSCETINYIVNEKIF